MVPVKLYIEYASTYLKKEGKYHKNTPKKNQTNKQTTTTTKEKEEQNTKTILHLPLIHNLEFYIFSQKQ